MSVDGRDEPLHEGGGTDGLSARKVPGQGGPGGQPGHRTGPETGAQDAGGAAEEFSVPAQRDPVGGEGAGAVTGSGELPPGDGDLLLRMREGDDTAYEELYRRHADGVRRYARTCCRDADTADDLTAEVFARMLQAVRGGAGPEYAVRAYLLTTVRRVAAGWTKSARREHLVEDFAVFAGQAARSAEAPDDETVEQGADVRAMHEAEQTLAMQAFRSLPERWQAVLWHTEVEDEAPSKVATLFGLDANGTRVLASRAREGLKQAYLQAHVSATLTTDGECARYADRLGAYARGGLRSRAERGLRKHLEECAKCRLAAGQIQEVAGSIPAVVPVAVIGWFGAAGYAKAAALFAGGTAGAGAAGAAGAAAGSAGGSGASGASGGAASEGLGAPVKAGAAAGLVAVAVAVVALALAGGDGSEPAKKPVAKPPASQPAAPEDPPPAAEDKPAPPADKAEPAPPKAPPAEKPEPAPQDEKDTPSPEPTPTTPDPTEPTPTEPPPESPTPPPPPAVYQWSELSYGLFGDGTEPEMRLGSSPVWQRDSVSIDGTRYQKGVTVSGSSSVTIDLNRDCSAYDALVGIDDLSLGFGKVRFTVYGDGAQLYRSPLVSGKDPARPVHVNLTGVDTLRLVVEPNAPVDALVSADWASSRMSC
ncbi:sigma-70 family RNA polymerase sigma factor [Streptomyces sp. SCSIO ZS0520]|uniref:sigma-70 family RNA polymerase sigma factor n=1 Tax=Streptomyces sp. SCSIO ZS0520 TaxID=2892996 RepID=UPI0021D9F246|nr:sigma-70 family RNA polymerase sigma factor [Streptomyces sp. SCSIO ZS0520]